MDFNLPKEQALYLDRGASVFKRFLYELTSELRTKDKTRYQIKCRLLQFIMFYIKAKLTTLI